MNRPGILNTFRSIIRFMTTSAYLPVATRRSSDLSKHSAEVFAEAEDHPVTVTQRDGESLVLMSQREAEGRARLLDLATQLITVTLDDAGTLTERMAKAFPWMLALSPRRTVTPARKISSTQPALRFRPINRTWRSPS